MILKFSTLWVNSVTRCIASCCLGFIVWVTLRTQFEYVRSFTAQLRIQNAQSAVIAPEIIAVTVAGPWKTVGDFINNKPVATINGQVLQKGLQEIIIKPDQLGLSTELCMLNNKTIPIFVNPNL